MTWGLSHPVVEALIVTFPSLRPYSSTVEWTLYIVPGSAEASADTNEDGRGCALLEISTIEECKTGMHYGIKRAWVNQMIIGEAMGHMLPDVRSPDSTDHLSFARMDIFHILKYFSKLKTKFGLLGIKIISTDGLATTLAGWLIF